MTDVTCTCGKPTGGPFLCQDCQHTLRFALLNVATFYVDLGTVERRQTRYGDGSATIGSIGRAQPAPVDMRFIDAGPERKIDHEGHKITVGHLTPSGKHVAPGRATLAPANQLRYDVWDTVVAWTRTLMAEQPPMAGPTCETRDCGHLTCRQIHTRLWPERPQTTVFIGYLTRQFDHIVRSTWAPQILDEFLDLERRLKRAVDRPPERIYLGVCTKTPDVGPACPGSVYAIEGELMGKCEECKAEYDVAASREGLESGLDSMLMTAADIARASTYLGLNADRDRVRKRINQWNKRGIIQAKGSDDNGDPRFSYGDVRARLYAEFSNTPRPTRAGA